MAHTLTGIVTSDSRDKTITVSIASRETHPLYRKQYTKTRKYTAHDENNSAHKGDKVEIMSCRPISKTKAYTLVKIVEKARGVVELKEGVTAVVEEKKVGADEIARANEERETDLETGETVEIDNAETEAHESEGEEK